MPGAPRPGPPSGSSEAQDASKSDATGGEVPAPTPSSVILCCNPVYRYPKLAVTAIFQAEGCLRDPLSCSATAATPEHDMSSPLHRGRASRSPRCRAARWAAATTSRCRGGWQAADPASACRWATPTTTRCSGSTSSRQPRAPAAAPPQDRARIPSLARALRGSLTASACWACCQSSA